MKLTVNRSELVRELNYVTRVVPSNPTIPVLGAVLIEAPGFGHTAIKLKTTNMDITLTASVENVEVSEKGGVCVWAKRFAKVLAEMTDDQVTISTDAKYAVEISGASCKFKLMGMAEEDYPVTAVNEGAPVELNGQVLADAVAPVLHAVSTDETRFVLNSVYLQLDPAGEVHAVATDGRRLAVCGGTVGAGSVDAVVPTAAARLLVTLAEAETVKITIGGGSIAVTGGARGFISKWIEGMYPNWKQVIPRDRTHAFELDVAVIKAAIHRVALVAPETVSLTFQPKKLVISGATADVGSGAESLPLANGPKEPIAISFAPAYVIEALTACGDTVTISLEDSASPMVLTADRFLSVIMPKRTT
jgi:DNA polymerase-3 subunit beta